MKTKFKLKYVLALSVGMLACKAFSHDVIVHMKITENAVASALAGSSAYVDFMNTVSSDCDAATALNQMTNGSARYLQNTL